MKLLIIRHARAQHNIANIPLFALSAVLGGTLGGAAMGAIASADGWSTGAVVGAVAGGVVLGILVVLLPVLRRLGIHDPDLTDLGERQAFTLSDELKEYPVPDLIVVSAATRCTRTATIAFPDRKLVASDLCREIPPFEPCCMCACDRRKSLTQLRERFPHVDYSGCAHEIDPIGREPEFETQRRVDSFTEMLQQFRSKGSYSAVTQSLTPPHTTPTELTCVAIVSHEGYMKRLVCALGLPAPGKISNAEVQCIDL
eukprot:TRINITY_DN1993_c0_g1_i1.p1 TRINITY_DN1993_c0_g1~~TRINITY_DN1993_c0_g1_i1.p1  ORF type:complete len:256 (+),score=24.47 TRINITY_DN1993_c0_g1_i1:110-877(+)